MQRECLLSGAKRTLLPAHPPACFHCPYCYTSVENRNSFKPILWETMENTAPGMCAPMAVNVTVGRSARPREYLTEREIERLIKAAGENRWGHRDATAVLIAYRHGLRASELVALRWDDIDFQTGKLHVRRAKGGTASVHPIAAGSYAPCVGSSVRRLPAFMCSSVSAWHP